MTEAVAALSLDGSCAPGFEGVREEFERNFRERGEVGASVCVRAHGATVWASAFSSYDRRSEFWDTALTSLPLPVAGPAFPFLRAKQKEVNERHLSHHRSNAKTHGNDEWEGFANSCNRPRF